MTQPARIGLGIMSLAALLGIFVFQHTDIAILFCKTQTPGTNFVVNRTIRYILNDLFMVILIYALFEQRKYIAFALYLQFAGIVLFLIPYFIFKLNWPSYNGPLVSFLHRLVINPLLMILLIPAIYYQKRFKEFR
jgi:exosortase F-associated protein